MGTLLRLADASRWKLPPHALFGRGANATIRLSERFASSEHARISWTGNAWELRDLGSRNGTYYNGAALDAGGSQLLVAKDRIGFGEAEAGWVLEEAGEPPATAIDLVSGAMIQGTVDLLQLPSSDAPLITVYRAQDGGWRVEEEGGSSRAATNRETIEVAGRALRLELPRASDETPMVDVAFALRNLVLRFHVPASQEKIALELVHGRRRQWLEPREHIHLLYVLANERGLDRDRPEAERGWRPLNWLTRALRMDDAAVNVLIHRARHQLASAGVEGAAEIIEVKRGQRRFGTDRFELVTDAR